MPNAKCKNTKEGPVFYEKLQEMRFFKHTPVLKPPVRQHLPLGHGSTIHLQEKPRGF
jgi:hypothetical protein